MLLSITFVKIGQSVTENAKSRLYEYPLQMKVIFYLILFGICFLHLSKIITWEDCGAFRSYNIECPSKCAWVVLRLLNPHRLLCQGDVVLTSCEQESLECTHVIMKRLSPRSFPRIKYHRPIGDGR